MEKFAEVHWTIADIQDLMPNWDEDQCEDWLANNQKYLKDVMIQRGWEYIEDMLPSDDSDD